MSKILVVGGSGFLGRACIDHLTSYKVAILGRKERACFLETQDTQYYQLDINKVKRVENFLKKNNFSHLLYLAWPSTLSHNTLEHLFFSASTTQFLNAFSYYNHNARIIVTGSIHETGVTRGKILNDFENMRPNSLYGVGKKNVWDAINILKIRNFCWVRFSNIYGIGDHLEKILFTIIKSELKNEPLILNHPDRIVDLVHINDAIKGILSALFSECSGVINIGGGYGYRLQSIQDFIKSYIQKIIHKKEKVKINLPQCSQDGPILDITKAFNLLDYQAFVKIDQGISECIEFLKNEEN